MRPTAYELPERAIEETRQALVYHIKEKLKQNSRYVGGVRVMCIFKGVNSYYTLSNVLKDDNWGIKYFLQQQKTFVLSYQQSPNPNDPDPLQESDPLQELNPLQEPDPLQESDPLQEPYKKRMSGNCS
ncbi:unnamed protein product [Rhizophagus irregularis]|nr:unnamed protein product [Rhizophagus irregularis]